jgi:hypothetical protein
VYVSSTTVTQFQGNTYVAGSSTNLTYTFEAGVAATGTILNTPILFTPLTGYPNTQGTLYIQAPNKSSTSTITIYASGLIKAE